MAIHRLKDIPPASLQGKYICAPSILSFQEFGTPAQVVKVTGSRLAYCKLARGDWDPVEKEWQVTTEVAEDEDPRQCSHKSVTLVCDTPEEAIALFVRSRNTRKQIDAMHSALLEDVRNAALNGSLSVKAEHD